MDFDVTEVLDFKTLCVRREGACSEREESSVLLHAPKFNVKKGKEKGGGARGGARAPLRKNAKVKKTTSRSQIPKSASI
jgi:hypothetical protein